MVLKNPKMINKPMPRLLQNKSKFLSLILRHEPENIGVSMDDNGWVYCKDILDNTYNTRRQITQSDINKILSLNSDYTISTCGLKIRANHGHSLKIDLGVEPKIPPKTLYHGTIQSSLKEISISGIPQTDRNYVHLSDDIGTAIFTSKRRKGNHIILYVDSNSMSRDGINFYKSNNGVWLTEKVDTKYIKQLK